MDAVQKANSGHPGTAMALAPLAYLLYTKHLRHNPANPAWPNRDRFVLSAGHACILQYAALHLSGYDLSLDDLKQFRQWESRTPGHPEHFMTPGVETTTGPLEAEGWHVQWADDANNLAELDQAIETAKAEHERPSLVVVRSHIGYGAPHLVDTAKAHGAPLGAEEVRAAKIAL